MQSGATVEAVKRDTPAVALSPSIARLWRWLAGVSVVWSATNLVGWLLQKRELIGPIIANGYPGANTTACVLILSFGIFLCFGTNQKSSHILGRILSGVVLTVMGMTLIEYSCGVDFHIDQLLCRDFLFNKNLYYFPGRPALGTATSLALLGGAVFCTVFKRGAGLTTLLSAISAWLCIYSICGYSYGIPLFQFFSSGQIAFTTAVALLVSSITIFLASSSTGPTRILNSDDTGGLVSRTFLTATAGFPFLGLVTGIGYQPALDLFMLVLFICAFLPILAIVVSYMVERQSRKLREQGELLNNLANSLSEVFWVTDAVTGRHLFISHAFDEVWGVSREKLEADPKAWLETIFEDDREKAMAHYFPKQTNNETVEFRVTRADGELRWLSARVTGSFDENGQCRRIYGIARDITDAKRGQQRLNEFYSTVSHELRTPFTSIRAGLGILEMSKDELPEKTQKIIEVTLQECDRMMRLINDLLDLSRIEAGLLTLREGNAPVSEIVDAAVSAVAFTAEASGVEIQLGEMVSGDLRCDRDRVVQVLINLISNAIKFSSAGSIVRVQAKSYNPGVRFEVIDCGPGVPAEAAKQIFTRFYQAGNRRQDGGLGLSISRAIVEQHKGLIGFDSDGKTGATFWFTLNQEGGTADSGKVIAG